MVEERLDRQLRIEGWDQNVLDRARIGVVGDDDLLASLYIMSASALGLNRLVALAPRLEPRLMEIAKRLNPELDLAFMEGFYVHSAMADFFSDCALIVDLCRYATANKLLLDKGLREGPPIVRAFSFEQGAEEGFRTFTYEKGREWREIEQILSPANLPAPHFDDGVFGIVASGLALEATKNVLMGKKISESVIEYTRKKAVQSAHSVKIGVVGAGALGNFVALGLAYAGFSNITFIDPDRIELVNLNRQVLFYDALGQSKSETLSSRLNFLFGISARSVTDYFRKETDISSFDVIFDCTDNFETRIIISEKCEEQGKVLISGGTNVEKGQVMVYDPVRNDPTPAHVLGLYDIVDRRRLDAFKRDRASCTYRPDPSVIMANQIVAGLMVDSYRILSSGHEAANIFFDSSSDGMIRVEAR